MSMNCIVVDDEETSRAIIGHLVDCNPQIVLLDTFQDAMGAIKCLNESSVDLVFLNIHMPSFTGFDLLKTVKNPPKIILTSSDKASALEAFDYECIVDFLIKPIIQERFDKSVERFMSIPTANAPIFDSPVPDEKLNDLYVSIDRRLVKIDIPSINIIEAQGDYIMLKTDTEKYMVHSTLKKIEVKLPTELFLKIHRSYIINIKKIIDIEDSSVLLGKDVVPVSRSNRPELLRRINLL